MGKWFAKLASKASTIVGHDLAFVSAVAFVLVWAITGPIFKFSET